MKSKTSQKSEKGKVLNQKTGRNLLAIIPARSGSKGIPNKNVRKIAGLPLIAWTIRAAKKSKLIDRVVVSTESKKIADIAKKYGAEVPFLRPKRLSSDQTPGIDVVLDCCSRISGYEEIVYLQPTSPLRTANDIDVLVKYARKHRAFCVLSVSPAAHHPAWVFRLGPQWKLKPFLEHRIAHIRQKLSKAYALNGAIYYVKRRWFMKNKKFLTNKTLGFPMPAERSLDIDDWSDWEAAKQALKK